MQKALEDVLYGICSMTEACQSQGLDYKLVRGVLLSKSFENCRMSKPVPLAQLVELKPDGYQKLYMDIFGVSDINGVKLPTDYEKTVLEVLQSLTDREQKVLCMRYGIGGCEGEEPMTLKEAGAEFGVNAERIRQIEAKALRKLRHPVRARQLEQGNEQYYANQQAHDAETKAHKEAVKIWLAEQIRQSEEHAQHPISVKALDLAYIDINEMEFSVRTYNCLRRSNINTLQDLLNTSDEQLMRVRNMGHKSLEETKAKRDEWIADITMRQKVRREQEDAK